MTRADRAIRRIREADRHGRPKTCPVCGMHLRGGRMARMVCASASQHHGGYTARWGRWRRCEFSGDRYADWDCQKDQWGIAEKREFISIWVVPVIVGIWVIGITAAIVSTSKPKSVSTNTVHTEPTKPSEVWIRGKVRTTFSMSFNDEKYRLNADSTVTFRDEAYDVWLTLPVSQVERFPKGSDEPPR